MLLAATAMAPWWIRLDGFGQEGAELRATFQFPYESWEGRVTLALILLVAAAAARVLADPLPGRRASRCVTLQLLAWAAPVAPTVYLYRTAMAREGGLLTVQTGRLESLGPGILLTLLALVGIGFGATMLYRAGRAARPRPPKKLDAPAQAQ
jgi:hypothetical protein